MTDVLLQEDTDGVRVLTLNRPGARNALSTELAAALHAALSAAHADEEVRVLVLTGADPAFCAGIDLEEAARDGDARRMSMTGQVIDAATAERIGLVTEVVPHDRLMARVMDCARAIAEVPPDTVRGLKEMYVAQAAVAPGLAAEREIARRHVPDWAGLEKRRLDVMARNRAQIGGGQV